MERQTQTRKTCRHWLQGRCRLGGHCQFDHFEHMFSERERSGMRDSYRPSPSSRRFDTPTRDYNRPAPNSRRPDTPTPTTQRSQTQRVEPSAKTELTNSANAAKAIPNPSVPAEEVFSSNVHSSTSSGTITNANSATKETSSSTEATYSPTDETSPSEPKMEEDFIYVEWESNISRYLKTECAVINREIEANYKNNPSEEPLKVIRTICEIISKELGTCRTEKEVWTYWKYQGKQDNDIASDWPPNTEDVDQSLNMSYPISTPKVNNYAVTAEQAALKAPVAVMTTASAANDPALWSKEQKEFLCKVIKGKQDGQCRQSRDHWWQEVADDMNAAGYVGRWRVVREYWHSQGRDEFKYDELPFFNKPKAKATPVKQTNPTNRPQPPANRYNSAGKTSGDKSYTIPRKVVPSRPLLPSGGKSRPRRGRAESMTARQRSLTPDSPSPLQPIKNRKRVSTGNEHSPGNSAKRRASSPKYKEPKAPVPQLADRMIHNIHSKYKVKDRTAKNAADFSLDLIVPKTGEVIHPRNKKTSLNYTESHQADSRQNIRPANREPANDEPANLEPANDEPAEATPSFDFRSPQQLDFSPSPEPTPLVSATVSTRVTQSTNRGRKSLGIGQSIFSVGVPIIFSEPETPESFAGKQFIPVRRTAGRTARGNGRQAEVESTPVVSGPDNVSESAIATDNQDTNNQDVVDYSDDDTIIIDTTANNGRLAKAMTESDHDSAPIPSIPAATASRLSATPSLVSDHSSPSDEQSSQEPSMEMEIDNHSIKSDDEMEDAPDGVEPSDIISKIHWQAALESTDSKISNLEKELVKVRAEKSEDEDRIEIIEDRINNLNKTKEELKESYASKVSEIQKLEERLDDSKKFKQGLQMCMDTKESVE